jgi:mannitol/fructose-specific phosphotransferase system IIA component (Ntr-type)
MLLKEQKVGEASLSLADYTEPSLIVPQLRQRDTAGVVKELSQLLHQQRRVPDVLAFYHAALNHEFLANSATESGIALPHARLNGVVHSGFAFGRSTEPFVWGTKGSAAVRFVFLLAVPATDAAGFLHLLSALARFGQQEGLLAALGSQQTAEEIFELFKQIKVRHG